MYSYKYEDIDKTHVQFVIACIQGLVRMVFCVMMFSTKTDYYDDEDETLSYIRS